MRLHVRLLPSIFAFALAFGLVGLAFAQPPAAKDAKAPPAKDAGKPVPVQLRDISTTGVGLVLPIPVPPETILIVTPWLRGRPRPFRVRVARHAFREFAWFHGCAFVPPLGGNDLSDWRG